MRRLTLPAAACLLLAACTQPTTILPGDHVTVLVPVVQATHPHDPGAFTQGLEFLDAETLVESTGGWGTSSIRLVEARSGTVIEQTDLPADRFGEGATVVDGQAWQLTWKAGELNRWTLPGLDAAPTAPYQGEGWGLCLHDGVLWRSDGSATLTAHDPTTFATTGHTLQVQVRDEAITRLNELECTQTTIWANIWQTEQVVGIDPDTGVVTTIIDASTLVEAAEQAAGGRLGPNEVLNGIAIHPETGHFWLTGKNWPLVFEATVANE